MRALQQPQGPETSMSKKKLASLTSPVVPSNRTPKAVHHTPTEHSRHTPPLRLHNAAAKPKRVKHTAKEKSKERTVAARRMKTSATGLKELSSLLERLNLESGATFLIAQHLDSEHQRKLRKLLSGTQEQPATVFDVSMRENYERAVKELAAKTAELSRLHQEMTTLLDNLQIPISLVSNDLRVRHCSRSASTLIHNSSENEPLITESELAEHIPDLRNRVLHVIESLQPMEQEFQDGEGHWRKLQIQPLKSATNVAPGLLLTLFDIDAQKRIESRLYTAQNREQQLLHAVTGILLLVNELQSVTLINKSGCDLLEYPEDSILGKNWFDTFVPEPQRTEAKAVFSALMTGKTEGVASLEIPVLTRSAQEKVVLWQYAALADNVGNPAGMLCTGQDVTGLRRMERALRESEKRLQTMMEVKRDDEFFIVDPAGTIVSWTPGTRLKEAYQPDEIVGKHFSSLYPLDDFVSGKPMRILRIAEQAGRYEEEGRRASKGGRIHRARSIVTAIRDEKGTLQGFSNVTRYLD
jgi:PAS domain S-box-containing protein